ncbi:MAG: hypothetical protein HZC05_04310, partial [Candidatus Magasanikbacteria bacterium]|nr:hypothetical protein [Candidatus Magasanikbacteria bacterium]
MGFGKQKNFFIAVLMMTMLFSLTIVRPSDAQDLGVVGLKPLDPSVLKAAAGIAPAADIPAGGVPVSVVSEPSKSIMKKIGGALAESLWAGVGFALDKAAYAAAIFVETGLAGEKPLWLASANFDNLVDGAIGESIYALGNNIDFLKKYGISLCVPPDLKLQMWLQLDLAEQWQPAAPHCSFKQIKNSWQQVNPWSDNFNSQRALSGIGVGFRPGQNDLSMLLAANQAIKVTSLREKEKAKEELAYRGQALSPVNTAGQAKVPVSLIEKLAQDLSEGGKDLNLIKAQSTADILQQGDWSWETAGK